MRQMTARQKDSLSVKQAAGTMAVRTSRVAASSPVAHQGQIDQALDRRRFRVVTRSARIRLYLFLRWMDRPVDTECAQVVEADGHCSAFPI